MTRCGTSLMGLIFGHKWHYRMWGPGLTVQTDYCTRCGYRP